MVTRIALLPRPRLRATPPPLNQTPAAAPSAGVLHLMKTKAARNFQLPKSDGCCVCGSLLVAWIDPWIGVGPASRAERRLPCHFAWSRPPSSPWRWRGRTETSPLRDLRVLAPIDGADSRPSRHVPSILGDAPPDLNSRISVASRRPSSARSRSRRTAAARLSGTLLAALRLLLHHADPPTSVDGWLRNTRDRPQAASARQLPAQAPTLSDRAPRASLRPPSLAPLSRPPLLDRSLFDYWSVRSLSSPPHLAPHSSIPLVLLHEDFPLWYKSSRP